MRRGPAPPEPPSCCLRGRCGDDQVGALIAGPGPARLGALERSIWERAAVRQAGTLVAWGQPGGTFAGRESRRPAPHGSYVE